MGRDIDEEELSQSWVFHHINKNENQKMEKDKSAEDVLFHFTGLDLFLAEKSASVAFGSLLPFYFA